MLFYWNVLFEVEWYLFILSICFLYSYKLFLMIVIFFITHMTGLMHNSILSVLCLCLSISTFITSDLFSYLFYIFYSFFILFLFVSLNFCFFHLSITKLTYSGVLAYGLPTQFFFNNLSDPFFLFIINSNFLSLLNF